MAKQTHDKDRPKESPHDSRASDDHKPTDAFAGFHRHDNHALAPSWFDVSILAARADIPIGTLRLYAYVQDEAVEVSRLQSGIPQLLGLAQMIFSVCGIKLDEESIRDQLIAKYGKE